MATTGHRLTAEEIELAVRDGFVVRHAVFDDGELRRIADVCEELVTTLVHARRRQRARAGSYVFEPNAELAMLVKWEGDSDVVHGLEPFAHRSPELKAWALDRRFIDPMIHFCGDDAPALFTEKLNLKRPHVGGQNPLHQDYPYWLDATDDPTRVATAMLYLDDADRENGCLQVLPGSHRGGPQRRRADSDEFGNLELDPRPFDDAALVAVEAERGSVVFFGSLLVHKSETNVSDRERRALLFSYGPHGQAHMSDLLAAEFAAEHR